jgi:hypothetical protein
MNSFRTLSVLGIHFGEPGDMSVKFTPRLKIYRYSQQCICERFSILKTIPHSHCSMVLIQPDRATTIQVNGPDLLVHPSGRSAASGLSAADPAQNAKVSQQAGIVPEGQTRRRTRQSLENRPMELPPRLAGIYLCLQTAGLSGQASTETLARRIRVRLVVWSVQLATASWCIRSNSASAPSP